MATPQASADYYRRQQRIVVQLLAALRKVWRRMDPKANWTKQYQEDSIGSQLVLLTSSAQVAATQDTDSYMGDVLKELGLVTSPGTVLAPKAFSGLTGSGLPVEDVMSLAVPRAAQAFNAAQSAPGPAVDLDKAAQEALDQAEQWIEAVAATIIADTARAASSAASAAHAEVEGYVRMLNPPSCSRCAVLAGQWSTWKEAFQRHPLCDCRMIPASEAMAGDLVVNPRQYFESLPSAAELAEQHPGMTVAQRQKAGLFSQEDIFTVAGAKAIRDGADIGQVVNARRGMQPAQVFNRDLLITTEGTTRRGLAYMRLGGGSTDRRAKGERYFRTTKVRLMPESIYQVAEDRDDAIRLLKLNGFIL